MVGHGKGELGLLRGSEHFTLELRDAEGNIQGGFILTAEPRCCWAWEYHGPILTQPKSCVAKPWSTSPSNPTNQFTAGLGSDPSGYYPICRVISGHYLKYFQGFMLNTCAFVYYFFFFFLAFHSFLSSCCWAGWQHGLVELHLLLQHHFLPRAS